MTFTRSNGHRPPLYSNSDPGNGIPSANGTTEAQSRDDEVVEGWNGFSTVTSEASVSQKPPALSNVSLDSQRSAGTPGRSSSHHSDWEQEEASLRDPPDLALPWSSPLQYLWREVGGSVGLPDEAAARESKRARIYNTMFHVPWRCELLITWGFLVCLDAFLGLLTVIPVRIAFLLWRLLMRQRRRVRADELSDVARLLVLVIAVLILQQADVSLIYHWIRGQATIKLYVIYNVLEIVDKLCQSFGTDVLQVLFNSADRVANCPSGTRLAVEVLHLVLDECIALASFTLHGFVILSQAVTLNVAINSHNNALLTLLVSNNFSEVKSNVFKRLSVDNLHKMSHTDTVERFHIATHLLFVLVQNIVRGEKPWLYIFAANAAVVLLCEMVVDNVKHAFLAKFNQVKPQVYSQFLQSLCRQTLRSGSNQVHRTLSFVPLSPACVVMRVVIPLFLSALPAGPHWKRCGAGALLGMGSFAALLTLKVLLGWGLQVHASWYLHRCQRKAASHCHTQ